MDHLHDFKTKQSNGFVFGIATNSWTNNVQQAFNKAVKHNKAKNKTKGIRTTCLKNNLCLEVRRDIEKRLYLKKTPKKAKNGGKT